MPGFFATLFRHFVPPLPCPYCPNPDRDSVFADIATCRYDNTADVKNGIIGGDPPCLCDNYAARKAG